MKDCKLTSTQVLALNGSHTAHTHKSDVFSHVHIIMIMPSGFPNCILLIKITMKSVNAGGRFRSILG
jgi:hypothetical protein